MTDGSIQGMSARMKWPGYYNGIPNGVWNAPPEQLVDMVHAYNKAGAHIHMHVNGDEASELMIDALEDALAEHPRRDHRHTLQHCQMADESQFRRMAALGICSSADRGALLAPLRAMAGEELCSAGHAQMELHELGQQKQKDCAHKRWKQLE